MDIAFALNYTNLYMIDTTPEEKTPTWARVGAGINSVKWDGNEKSSDDDYYDGEGQASTEVTGGQIVGSFSGHRKFGDPAQDYIASLAVKYGAKRHTNFKRIAPDGTVTTGDVTLANISEGGGDPNSKGDFSFEARFNGLPVIEPGNKHSFPESITASAVTVKIGQKVKATATVSPATASDALLYAVEDDTVAKVAIDGTVTGVKAGKTNLTVKSAVLPSVGKTVEITVTAA